MSEFGWTNPVLLDEQDGIIAGHGRVLAAKSLGYADAPCMVARGWSEAQKRAYVIADNKLALDAGWDDGLLKIEFGELAALNFNLELTGFSLGEIAAIDLPHGQSGAGSLAEKFMVAPFSVLNAREGWWQDRKRAWLDLGIMSEMGRGEASPGGSDRPAADYSAGDRGDGAGRARHKANAIPGGASSQR